jgi:hypothetical protein
MLITGGAVTGYAGYKLYDWNKTPDIAYLEQKRNLIGALADHIIPATDSPGARESGAPDFIISMVKDCTERKTQNKFIDGLKMLESYCRSSFGRPFPQCDQEQQAQTLRHFEERGKPYNGIVGKVEDKFFGKSFFSTLKNYTAMGYCTSELGATKGLSYLFIPGKFVGCMPLQPGQKSWATS